MHKVSNHMKKMNMKTKTLAPIHWFLPYVGEKGCMLARSWQNQLKRSLPDNLMSDIVYTSAKLSSHFGMKIEIPFQEKHDLVYQFVCVTENCNEDYVGAYARRLWKHVKDHNIYSHSSISFNQICSWGRTLTCSN